MQEVAAALERFARERGCAMILVGHVTKEGTLAGPRVLEHAVDCVLQFEGERERSFRTLRALKNRFGSTNEIGVFEMRAGGLDEVADPSERFLRDAEPVPGSCVLCAMEGTPPAAGRGPGPRCPHRRGPARRVANGIDRNRLSMILAVLARHGGPSLGSADVFVNVAGGVRIDEPGADLAVALAVASAAHDEPLSAAGRRRAASARSGSPASCATSPTQTAAWRRRPASASSGSCCRRAAADDELPPCPAGLAVPVPTLAKALEAALGDRRRPPRGLSFSLAVSAVPVRPTPHGAAFGAVLRQTAQKAKFLRSFDVHVSRGRIDRGPRSRQEPRLLRALEMVAPARRWGGHRQLRAGANRSAGLIGDEDGLAPLLSGGIELDIEYTPAFDSSWRRWTARSRSRRAPRS